VRVTSAQSTWPAHPKDFRKRSEETYSLLKGVAVTAFKVDGSSCTLLYVGCVEQRFGFGS
jgi:hypothetical protein